MTHQSLHGVCIIIILTGFIGITCLFNSACRQTETSKPAFRLVMHGGAGTIDKQTMTPERAQAYRDTLTQALRAGYEILDKDGSSIDAVEASIKVLEDSPLFNAGKGAVFTSEGTVELDASMMDGKTLNAGAVAGVRHIKNPIALARLIMEHSPHVMMEGEGAEAFARQQGVSMVPQEYFFTEERWQQLQKIRESEGEPASTPGPGPTASPFDSKHGTVGAVALDKQGNLAAGTSTGGMTNKKFGRVGDSPIIGAGTYANNNTCAVSCTGQGEFFIRSVVAYDVSALMEYKGLSVTDASEKAIMEKVTRLGGTGGLIAMDSKGNFAMPFNTPGMYRGYIDPDGKIVIQIYKD